MTARRLAGDGPVEAEGVKADRGQVAGLEPEFATRDYVLGAILSDSSCYQGFADWCKRDRPEPSPLLDLIERS